MKISTITSLLCVVAIALGQLSGSMAHDSTQAQTASTPAPTTMKQIAQSSTPSPTTVKTVSTPAPTTSKTASTPAPTTSKTASTPATSSGKKDKCVNVSVEGDATYCITGPVCSGGSKAPAGVNCPQKGDVAVESCLKTLKSYTDGGKCVAPVDAECKVIKTNVWGCVWKGSNPVGASAPSASKSSTTPSPTTGKSAITPAPTTGKSATTPAPSTGKSASTPAPTITKNVATQQSASTKQGMTLNYNDA